MLFDTRIPDIRDTGDLVGSGRDVADPWYTGDFAATYADVSSGCAKLLELIAS